MSELELLATNKAKVRAAARKLNSEQLENLIDGFSTALDKKLHDEEIQQESLKAKAESINMILELIADSNLTIDDLIMGVPKKSSKRKPSSLGPQKLKRRVPAKYSLTINGEEHKWSGRGLKPRVFRDYLADGNDLEALLID